MIKYVIPARKGSKGLPGKNRMLFEFTKSIIPEHEYKNVWVTTDDEEVKKQAQCFNVHNRDEKLAGDCVTIKDVLLDVSKQFDNNDVIVMLYLTYPERTWKEVQRAIVYWNDNAKSSMLCKKAVKTNPFLCMYDKGLKGEQIIKHNLYRRQDYLKCFEISHYIFISRVSDLKKLNNNLYDEDTIYFKIDDPIDIDAIEDYERFKNIK